MTIPGGRYMVLLLSCAALTPGAPMLQAQGYVRAVTLERVDSLIFERLCNGIALDSGSRVSIQQVISRSTRSGRQFALSNGTMQQQDSIMEVRNRAVRALIVRPADLKRFDENVKQTNGGRKTVRR